MEDFNLEKNIKTDKRVAIKTLKSKKILTTICVLILIMIGVYYVNEWLIKSKYISILEKTNIELFINNAGPSTRTFYLHENQIVDIKIVIKKEGDENLENLAKYLIDKKMIDAQIEGVNQEKLKFSANINGQELNFNTSYLTSNHGEDRLKVSIKDTKVNLITKLVTPDTSSFIIPIDLKINDISFAKKDWLPLISTDVYKPDTNFSNWLAFYPITTSPYYPEHITYQFKTNKNEYRYAYLAIAPISKNMNKNEGEAYDYVRNIYNLKDNIHAKPALPNELKIASFPPVNAKQGPISKAKFVNFKNGTGMRYINAGWYQAYEAASNLTYTYQGITDNGKYYILFRYYGLQSPLLENYIKTFSGKIDYEDFIDGSFDAVKRETFFSPSLEELDKFVESIKAGK